MTTEQHIILYNIGMRLSCNNSLKWHLCPNEEDYKYFVYWQDMFGMIDKKFGSVIDEKKIQIERETGKEKVTLKQTISICSKFPGRMEMVSQEFPEKNAMLLDMEHFWEQAVIAVAVEKAQVLKREADHWNIPMIDFADAFDGRALVTHLRSLIWCYLETVCLDKDASVVIKRIKSLFCGLEQIYDERKKVIKQIESYMEMMLTGIEKQNVSLERYLMEHIWREFESKILAEDFLSFLFADELDRERFQECVTVFAAYLRAYSPDSAEDLLIVLQKYENGEKRINDIAGLAAIDLESPKAEKANARLIERYLKDQIKYNDGVMFECIA